MSDFKFAKQFTIAAHVCNKISVEKFPLLLNRLISKLHMKGLKLFSDDEHQQLQKLFSLSSHELNLVLDGCCFIFEQAAFTSTGPEALYSVLLEAGFDEKHGKVIGKVWAEEAPIFVEKLKNRNLGAATLVDTDYHLNLTLGINDLTRLQEPSAIFEFSVTNPDMEPTQYESEKDVNRNIEKISAEFDHGELYAFFENLEKIQAQLDALA
jgi:hypothetical protein